MKEWFTISSWCIITDRYTMTTSLFSLIITQCWQIGSLLLRLWWDSLAITRLWALSHLWRCWSLFRRLCRCHHLTRSQDHHSTSDHWMNISPVEQKRSSALITLITEHIAGEQKRTYSWTGVCVWSGAWQIKSCGQLPDKLTITTVTLTRGPGRTVWRGIKNKSKHKHRAMSRDYNYPPRYHQLSPLITLNTLSAE